MKIELRWRRHPEYPTRVIIGQADDLPDSRCWFMIIKLKNGDYSIQLPALGGTGMDCKFIMRDGDTARAFCTDYLHYNFMHIVKNQLREMRNTNQHPVKPPAHYEMILQKYEKLIQEHKVPAKVAA